MRFSSWLSDWDSFTLNRIFVFYSFVELLCGIFLSSLCHPELTWFITDSLAVMVSSPRPSFLSPSMRGRCKTTTTSISSDGRGSIHIWRPQIFWMFRPLQNLQNLYTVHPQNWGICWLPLPLCADVICGSPRVEKFLEAQTESFEIRPSSGVTLAITGFLRNRLRRQAQKWHAWAR